MILRVFRNLATKTDLALVLGLFGLSVVFAQGQAPGSVAGTYRDEKLVVQLTTSSPPGDPLSLSGTIRLGTQSFPLKGKLEGSRLTGTFESEGTPFDFTGTLTGRTLTFTTAGTTYQLTKDITNPLARSGPSNPLASLKTNTPARTAPAVSNLPPKTAPILSANAKAALLFTRFSLLDDPTMIGGEAFSMLIPSGWQVEGGLGWRLHASAPMFTALRIYNPAQTESLQAYPTIPFIWADDGIPLFPKGSNYLGNEVQEPLHDPALYIKQVVIPRFRRELAQARVISAEEMPGLADAIENESKEPGVEKKIRAARVRVEYAENARTMQEDLYCVLLTVYVPAIKTTFWGADRTYSFRAEKGRLDSEARIFQTIVNSFRPTLPWYNRYLQLLQMLAQVPIETLRRPADLSTLAARTSEEIGDVRRQLFERQQTVQDRINSQFAQYVRGLQRYINPFDKRFVDLPDGYREVWGNVYGQYALGNDSAFNPNVGETNNIAWKRAVKAP